MNYFLLFNMIVQMFVVFCVCLFISRFSADEVKHLPQEEGVLLGVDVVSLCIGKRRLTFMSRLLL